jgi:hypothetical protein
VGAATSSRVSATVAAVALALGPAGCGGERVGACATAVPRSSFVFVQAPASGQRTTSGLRVTGCSSTFEATIGWRLRARDGRVLASGFAQGGTLKAGPFGFTVRFSVVRRQVGSLEVYEPRVTTEGFPPVRNVVPLVLEP